MRTFPALSLDGLDRLIALLQGLPIGVHGGAVLALIAGVSLFLFGARVLKPCFAILGMCAGSLAGAIALPLLGVSQVGSFPSVYVGLLAGAVGGIVIACLLFRFALGIASGVVFAAAGLLGAAIYLNHQHPGTIDPPARLLLAPAGSTSSDRPETSTGVADLNPDSAITSLAPDGSTFTLPPGADGKGVSGLSSDTEKALLTHADRARTFVDQISARMHAAWDSVETSQRLILTGGALAGAVVGVLFGLTMPKRSAAMVTSLAGAAIVLASSVWLAGAADAPGKDLLELQPRGIGIALALATLTGMVLQLTVTAKKGGTPQSDA